MSPQQFDFVLGLVEEDLQRQYVVREPICPAERLAITLRYLSCGDLVRSIALSFRVGISTARAAIRVTCEALWTRLQPLYIPEPDLVTWLRIADGFSRTWQIPNCVGAMDGKHIQIRAPAKSGSMYFNYKGTFSIVLLAVVDSAYKFAVVDVGTYGKQSDGGVLQESTFGKRLEAGKLHLPRDLPLPATTLPAPCVFVGDKAFQLRHDLLRPYPGRGLEASKRVYNYRLSRARTRGDDSYCPPGYGDTVSASGQRNHGQWRQQLAQPPMQVARAIARNFGARARYVREMYRQYFSSAVGSVPWQDAVL